MSTKSLSDDFIEKNDDDDSGKTTERSKRILEVNQGRKEN